MPIRPNVNKKDQVIESMSEFFLLHFFYGVMMCETYDVPSVKFNFGWYSVACVVAIMLLNLFSTLYDNIRHYYTKAKALFSSQSQPRKVDVEVGGRKIAKKKKQSQPEPPSVLEQSERKALFVIPEVEAHEEGESEEGSPQKPTKRISAGARLEMVATAMDASQLNASVLDETPYRVNSVPDHQDPMQNVPISMQSAFEKDSMELARRLMKVQEGRNAKFAELEEVKNGVLVALDDIPDIVPLDDIPDRTVPLDDIPDRVVPLDDMIDVRNLDVKKNLTRRNTTQNPQRKISLKDAMMASYKAEPNF
jgi:hypothetical protein